MLYPFMSLFLYFKGAEQRDRVNEVHTKVEVERLKMELKVDRNSNVIFCFPHLLYSQILSQLHQWV